MVLAYTARGFGESGGLIHLDSPDYEVADAEKLVSYLATLPQVKKDGPGDPRVGVAGSSYGGGLALLLAGYDKRVDAVAADITWNSLAHSLFPNAVDRRGRSSRGCSRSSGPASCSAAVTRRRFTGGRGVGNDRAAVDSRPTCARPTSRRPAPARPTPAILSLLAASSPASILAKIKAPTLLTQGEQDSLFPLTEADANARGIAATGTPVKVMWRAGGHDGGSLDLGAGRRRGRLVRPDARRTAAPRRPGRSIWRCTGSAISSETGQTVTQTLQVDSGYPLQRRPHRTRSRSPGRRR